MIIYTPRQGHPTENLISMAEIEEGENTAWVNLYCRGDFLAEIHFPKILDAHTFVGMLMPGARKEET